MLQHIHIKDLAIVTDLEMEFCPGMTALTGETGAGKSILIDALGLVLGDRADNGMIRNGCERAEISAGFTIDEKGTAADWLRENALDDGDQCILRRVLTRTGNSRAFINGSPAPVKTLQQLGELMVDIHGQHAHQSLLRRDHQRELLDGYAGHQTLCEKTAALHHDLKSAKERLADLAAASLDREARIDLLSYQINELDELKLEVGELETLLDEHKRLSNAGELIESCNRILNTLNDGDETALTLINRALSELNSLNDPAPGLKESREMLESAAIQVEEAASNLRDYGSGLELSPDRLDQLDRRLTEIHDLARKYRCRPETLLETQGALTTELDQLKNTTTQLSNLEQEVATLWSDYREQALRLDKSRKTAAKKLSKQVVEGIHSLGMSNGMLKVDVITLDDEKASAFGLNQIELLFSANPGQPPQPLSKVASGGELSRLSLAIQVATISCAKVPTLIFDEVDVGIGGGVAEIVGRLLRKLGESRQVLCVTHLPQVASLGHQHLLIHKESKQKRTHTHITQLDQKQRIEEVARMLGGLDITGQTLAHAREMVQLKHPN
ncbi:MAG: DNA repair protein RecN [Candidatus Sedimenticola sp. (ex Thyasira tokunagai)]